ncbi:50S ribosomal protein L11 methyltransferase [Rhizorhabdus dicambivorans]|uniref:Ribosomal protein L11 methyltransferase n=1 Tax=Rhizorhabdus dicambivorans TaxID=1850238 RepID=A0A2A4FS61_9SPHN|nr:50S ribosomal protein L11 methyltransferase [Rhizorhabdus dicambivorans]ATE64398.1 50S ribosomal protein L11 methyltransferase [Rhizorhabdus dicambivorans]PCE41253.1 50S ribosomal protein L11 methyltransferase [Rhizorhabdus dicambivorans]
MSARPGEPKGDGITGFPFAPAREGSWKVTLPCTKAEAERIAEDIPELAPFDPQPTVMTSEPDPERPDDWQLDVYVEDEPDKALLTAIAALAPSAAGAKPVVTHIPEEDWVTLSQSGLEPIRAGRFFVHTPYNADRVPDGMTGFLIDAGRAFGTGHHETTTGCLMMLDKLRQSGLRFDDIADIGTGTGLLAFAARALWPAAKTIASDIDPVSIEVTAENAAVNAIPTGRGRGQVELAVAAGMDHRRLKARAPYDLLIANILAGPLIELAPVFADAVLPGGTIILAGLLDSQAEAVAQAYRRQGFYLADRIVRGDWPTLRLVKRRR